MEKTELERVTGILGLMSEAEAAVRDFYMACAVCWEKESDLWRDFAEEEAGHVRILERMTSLITGSPELYSVNRPFNLSAYRAFISQVRFNTEEVSRGVMPNAKAVDIAGDIEKSILESKIQELVSTEEKEYLDLVAEIINQTRRHRDVVKAMACGILKF